MTVGFAVEREKRRWDSVRSCVRRQVRCASLSVLNSAGISVQMVGEQSSLDSQESVE